MSSRCARAQCPLHRSRRSRTSSTRVRTRRRRRRETHRCPTSTRSRRPKGSTTPRHEHDACGVAFVATLTGEASHDIVAKALTALRNLDHRGAAGAEPNSGDGAGILMQVPDAFLREVTAEVGFELPPPARVRRRHGVPARRRRARWPRPVARIEEIAAEEGLAVLGWREVPTDPSILGATALGVMPTFRQLFVAGGGPAGHRHGAGADGLLPAQARRARDRRLLPLAVVAHPGLQGHAHHRAARPVLPRPGRRARRLGAGRGALALLDQHLPELAALAPVPLHRPQRRDQHRDGQPQLDAGPRGAARLRPDPRRPRAALPDLHRPAPPTRRPSTRCSSCCTWAGARCRTRC